MNSIIVLNSGSSSVKFAVHDRREGLKLRGQIKSFPSAPILEIRVPKPLSEPVPGVSTIEQAVDLIIDKSREAIPDHGIDAVAHRVVHGGTLFEEPTIIDDAAFDALGQLCSLAPKHQPGNLAGIRAAARHCPEALQTASFDTCFHSHESPHTRLYALPRDILAKGVRRYGFHGLSYAYTAEVMAKRLVGQSAPKIIAAHLGSGASLCAMRGQTSIATSMGFTALDGLPMATRCGNIDPGVLLFLLDEEGMSTEELSHMLYSDSGLKGLSGRTGDMAELLQHMDEPDIAEAIDYYCHRICLGIGEMAAALGGADALVFSGGVGEHAALIRSRIVDRLGWLGFALDPQANECHAERISPDNQAKQIHIVHSDEEEIIRRDAEALLRAAGR